MTFPRTVASMLALLVLAVPSVAERIDGSFPFESDPSKAYSLYIPSSYEPGTPNRLMVGFHPLNTARWNAESWCDTLITFAETNGLLLACPDGGADGRVDDPIDLAFTTALMDSMEVWYDVDVDKIYAMGFSWGGRATYTYGLDNADRFGGLIPIGAAINGTTEIGPFLDEAEGEAVYIVHGGLDTPGVRFHPAREALIDAGAIVSSLLMPGVGHTIDFPDRNQILSDAFSWVDSVNCAPVVFVVDPVAPRPGRVELLPNPAPHGTRVAVGGATGHVVVEVFDVAGRRVLRSEGTGAGLSLSTVGLSPGTYLVRVTGDGVATTGKLVLD